MYLTRTTSRYNKPACPEMGSPAGLPTRHGRGVVERSIAHNREGRKTKRPGGRIVLADVELKRIEDALLESLLDTHTNRDNALDRLLDDMTRVEADERVTAERSSRTLAAPSKKARIEELLVAAVLDNHPNRSNAIDRIFADLSIEEEAARHDMSVDNDFDGLA